VEGLSCRRWVCRSPSGHTLDVGYSFSSFTNGAQGPEVPSGCTLEPTNDNGDPSEAARDRTSRPRSRPAPIALQCRELDHSNSPHAYHAVERPLRPGGSLFEQRHRRPRSLAAKSQKMWVCVGQRLDVCEVQALFPDAERLVRGCSQKSLEI